MGDFDEALGSLADGMANRLLAFRHGFYFDPAVLSAWRRSPDSMSGRTALSATDSRRGRSMAAQYIRENFPADVRDEYGPLFDRRFRFNVARLRLTWGARQLEWRELFDLLDLPALDRAAMRSFARLPRFSSHLVLMWLALRLRPFGMRALAAAWWRRMTFGRSRRAALQALVTASGVMQESPTTALDLAGRPMQSRAASMPAAR
jgi:hypothetical protein